MPTRDPIKKEIKEIRQDIVNVEKKIDGIQETLHENTEMLKKIPTRDNFPRLLLETLEFATLKTEHDRMKKIIREKLQVEV